MTYVLLRFSSVYPSLNKMMRMHWRKRDAIRREYFQSVGAQIRAAGTPRFAGKVKIELSILRASNARRKHDNDNWQPKWLLDALVKAGVIKDDNSEIIPEPIKPVFVYGEPRDGIDVKITSLEE